MNNNLIVPLAAISVLLLLPSCTSVRETLGLERSAPDEFAVTPSQVDLEMPPDFYKLPEPRPGAQRPQEMSHRSQARSMLTGTDSHSHAYGGGESAGTSAFLQQAGVESGQDHVRTELYQEAEVEKRKGKSLAQELGIKTKQPGTVLKPVEEQKRLQEAGVETSKYIEESEDDN